MSANNTSSKGKELYLRLLKYTFRHKLVFVISLIAMAAFAVTDTAFAALMKPLLDGSFVEKDPEIIQMFPFLKARAKKNCTNSFFHNRCADTEL